ncbi:MAG: hypothetical protein HUU01_12350, partial [Saprospiraceae bacterium]|nr:hypothetical protein [Saprospiraceae bacterium]
MKTFNFLCLLIVIPFLIHAQTTTFTYLLNDPGLSPSRKPAGPVSTTNPIEVLLRGTGASDCEVSIIEKVPCAGEKDKKILISAPEQTDGSGARSFEINVFNNGQKYIPTTISRQGSATSAPATLSEANNPSPAKNTVEQACTISGPVLIWQDALTLEQAMQQNKWETIRVILCKYAFPYESCSTCIQRPYADLLQAVNAHETGDNFFLRQALPKILPAEEIKNPSAGGPSGVGAQSAENLNSVISSPGIVLDAIATFVAKRLLDELNMAYLDTFRDKLEQEGLKDLRAVLPQTKFFLATIGKDDRLEYKSLLTGLRQNLFEDLTNLPLNMPKVIKNHKEDITDKESYISALAMLEAMNNLAQKATPPDIISRVGSYDYELGKDSSNTLTIVRLAAKISNHLRVNDPYGTWINPRVSFQNPRVIYLFSGLIFKQDGAFLKENSIKYKGKWTSLYDLLKAGDSQMLIETIHQVLGLITEISELVNASEKSDPTNLFFALNERLLTFMAYCTKDDASSLTYTKALETLKILVRVRQHIQEKELVAAGTLVFSMLDYLGANKDITARKEFFRYLSFAQNLIDAKTKEELIDALEQAADPAGNYRLKRNHPLTVSITSYPGLYAGREQYRQGINDDKYINSFGFTAPLGLAVSFSGKKESNDEPSTSFSLFFPVIDVGAITAFRLMDRQADLPDFKWGNFISPGVFGNLGFKNSPLSFHAGIQYAPE